VVDKLSLLPPLPLVIDYQSTTILRARDLLGISHALRLRNRVRRVDLHVPPWSLRNLLVLMDEPFPILEHLSLSSTAEDMSLILPKAFLAPNLHHLKLHGVNLCSDLPSLSSTLALVTLTLENIRESGHFLPKHLITRLGSFQKLEKLFMGFSIPFPLSSAEREILDPLETPVTLPSLKSLTLRGVSAHLESLAAQIRAPLLEKPSITIFNQVVFATLPHLSHLINTTEGLKPSTAEITFQSDAVAVVTGHDRLRLGNGPSSFSLRMFNVFDREVDCAAQICSALRPVLSGVEQLTILCMPADWKDGNIDSAMWRKLLRPFIGVKRLHISCALQREIAHALELRDAG
jgi:hypothetical protein